MLNFYIVKFTCLFLVIVSVIIDSRRFKNGKELFASPMCIFITTIFASMPIIGIPINLITLLSYTLFAHFYKGYFDNVFTVILLPIIFSIITYSTTMFLVADIYASWYIMQILVIEGIGLTISFIMYLLSYIKCIYFKIRYSITFKEAFYMKGYAVFPYYCLVPMLLWAAI